MSVVLVQYGGETVVLVFYSWHTFKHMNYFWQFPACTFLARIVTKSSPLSLIAVKLGVKNFPPAALTSCKSVQTVTVFSWAVRRTGAGHPGTSQTCLDESPVSSWVPRIFQGVCRRKKRLLLGLKCLFLDENIPIEPSLCLNLHQCLGQGIISGSDSLLLSPTHLRSGRSSLGEITQCRHTVAPVLWVPRMAWGLDGNLGFNEAKWGHLVWVALIHWHLWHLCQALPCWVWMLDQPLSISGRQNWFEGLCSGW